MSSSNTCFVFCLTLWLRYKHKLFLVGSLVLTVHNFLYISHFVYFGYFCFLNCTLDFDCTHLVQVTIDPYLYMDNFHKICSPFYVVGVGLFHLPNCIFSCVFFGFGDGPFVISHLLFLFVINGILLVL